MVGHLEVPELGKIRLRFLHILFIICFVGNWAFKAWFYRCLEMKGISQMRIYALKP